jgi:hypothetical protein
MANSGKRYAASIAAGTATGGHDAGKRTIFVASTTVNGKKRPKSKS